MEPRITPGHTGITGRPGRAVRRAKARARGRAKAKAKAAATATARDARADRRLAGGCAALFLGLMVTLDGCAGTLTVVRAGLWTGGAVLVLVMLWPPRVTADERWLTVRGPLGARRIRVDALVCVQRYGLVAAVLELRDARGRRLRLPTAVLEADPVLWQAVESGIRRSRERGTLLTGRRAAAAAAARVDARAAEILHASGLG